MLTKIRGTGGSRKILVASLCVAVLLLLLWRLSELFFIRHADFDSLMTLLWIEDFFGSGAWDAFTDTAHPGLLAGWATLGRKLSLSEGNPFTGYQCLLAISLILSVCLLVAILRLLRCSKLYWCLGVALFLLNPAIVLMSASAEENLFGQTVFLASVFALLLFFRRANMAWGLLVGVLALVAAAQHLQVFAVLLAATVGCVAVQFARRCIGKQTTIRRYLAAAVIWLSIGVTWYLLVFGPLNGRVSRYQNFDSLVNHSDTGEYLLTVVRNAQVWLITDFNPEPKLSELGLNSLPGFYPLLNIGMLMPGLLLIGLILLMARRFNFVDLVLLSSVALPLVYEPQSAERWDLAGTALVLCLVPQLALKGAVARSSWQIVAWLLTLILLIAGFFNLVRSGPPFAVEAQREQLSSSLGSPDVVFADSERLGEVWWLRFMLPARVRVEPIVPGGISPGSLIYAPSGVPPSLGVGPKPLNCQKTTLDDFCRIR